MLQVVPPQAGEASSRLAARLLATKERQLRAREAGLPALGRLVVIASGDTGQSITVRKFLLGLYNGSVWPFDLTDLRGLDFELIQDALRVLEMDSMHAINTEIHKAVEDGDRLFKEWWRSLRPEDFKS